MTGPSANPPPGPRPGDDEADPFTLAYFMLSELWAGSLDRGFSAAEHSALTDAILELTDRGRRLPRHPVDLPRRATGDLLNEVMFLLDAHLAGTDSDDLHATLRITRAQDLIATIADPENRRDHGA